METLTLKLSQDAIYDDLVHHGAKQASEVTICTKDVATESGRAGAVIGFLAEHNGELVRVQATVTVRNLLIVLAALQGRYGEIPAGHTN